VKRRLAGVVAAGTAALAIAGLALAAHPGGGGAPIGAAVLTGAEECSAPGVCGVGDPTASGSFLMRVNVGQAEVCYELAYSGSETPFAAHVHRAPAGAPGPIEFGLETPTPTSAGCVAVSPELAKELIQNPERFYVNVHTPLFRGGAVRGQLGHVAPGQVR
jgi:hypothetical protein